MLRREIKNTLIVLIFIYSASCNSKKETDFKVFNIQRIGETEYFKIYNLLNDSLTCWANNKIGYYKYLGITKSYLLDSLLCFNNKNTRFLTCILMQQLSKESVSDDIDFMYGEKINGEWYFFSGGNVFLPRDYYQKNIHIPLSFSKMHEIALKEIYGGGYLTKDDKINENWFKGYFEGKGWCGADTCDEKDYEAIHLQKTRNNWAWRDTSGKKTTLP